MNTIFSPSLMGSSPAGAVFAVALFLGLVWLGISAFKKEKKQVATRAVVAQPIIGCCTIIGTRPTQQDCAEAVEFNLEDGRHVALGTVCDGMGGMKDGGRASRHSVDRLSQLIAERGIPESPLQFLREAVKKIDAEVYSFKDEDGQRLCSGSTLVSAMYDGRRLHWVSVGDSRIYLLHGGKLRQLTRDHNYANFSGNVTGNYVDDVSGGRGDALVSFIGIGKVGLIDADSLDMQPGDILLLCSDGVTKLVEDAEIEKTLNEASGGAPGEIAKLIVEKSVINRVRAQDNTTAVIIKV